MTFDVARLRQRFPTLQHKVYLNSGSYGLLSHEVRGAFAQYLDSRERSGSDWTEWIAQGERLRALLARLLHAEAAEIAITGSASAGINAIASALCFDGARRKIVISDFEFPTTGQIWHGQEPRGAQIVHVPQDATGLIPIEHFEHAIDQDTALVAVSHVCYRQGALLDIARISELAHRKGALVLLDCYQSVGVTDIDVKKLDVDFAVAGMLKYLLGTAGIGFLYARASLADKLVPTVGGWFAQANPDAMDSHHNVPAPDARRFQAGTPPVAASYAAAAGLGIILELGTANIERYVRQLTAVCMDRMQALNWQMATPRHDQARGPQIAIRSVDDAGLVKALGQHNIVVSARDGNVRAMFHCYNDESDVDALIEAVGAHSQLLRQHS